MSTENGTTPVRELREFQFVVQTVLLVVEDGKTPRPLRADPLSLTGLEELQEFINAFPAELKKLNEQGVNVEMEKAL
jgi:hypothetical protein